MKCTAIGHHVPHVSLGGCPDTAPPGLHWAVPPCAAAAGPTPCSPRRALCQSGPRTPRTQAADRCPATHRVDFSDFALLDFVSFVCTFWHSCMVLVGYDLSCHALLAHVCMPPEADGTQRTAAPPTQSTRAMMRCPSMRRAVMHRLSPARCCEAPCTWQQTDQRMSACAIRVFRTAKLLRVLQQQRQTHPKVHGRHIAARSAHLSS